MNFNPQKAVLFSVIRIVRPLVSQSLHTSKCQCSKTYYEVLNLRRNCNAKEIRESFINLAKKYHPDTNQTNPESHARFVELQQAYSVLSSPSKRQDYDCTLSDGQASQSEYYRSTSYRTYDANKSDEHFDDDFKDLFYRSRRGHAGPKPSFKAQPLQFLLFFTLFTCVGAGLQYYILRLYYTYSFNEEMERHHRGLASYQALEEKMNDHAEEYDLAKLRKAYFNEVIGNRGSVGIHLVPPKLRPDARPSSLEEHLKPLKEKVEKNRDKEISESTTVE